MRVAKLRESAIIPTKKHPDDAGWDLYSFGEHIILPNSFKTVPTGITLEIPKNVVGIIKPRGRSDYLIGAGVVDAGYQGEIMVKVVNPYTRPINIPHGLAFAQIVFILISDTGLVLEEVSLNNIHQTKSLRSATGGIHGLEVLDEGTSEYRGWD